MRDLHANSWTGILAVRGRSFALLDAGDKERRLASWAAVLAGLAREGSPVRRLQWVERSRPGDAALLRRSFDARHRAAAEVRAVASYDELLEGAGPTGQDHRCYVAVSVRARCPGGPGVALARELRLLEGQLRAADIDVDHPLSPAELSAVLRGAFEAGGATVPADPANGAGAPVVGPGPFWPAATDDGWSWWRTDDTWHATFWVAEWPRSEVGPDFLSPLLLQAGTARSFAVVMAPLPLSAGVREAEAARTAQAADDQLRDRAGFLATARRRREAEGIARREAELSEGHAAYRFSGYLTVSAVTLDALEVACGELLQVAHQCRLELRRLHGVQDLAFSWTLPLGRGLAGR